VRVKPILWGRPDHVAALGAAAGSLHGVCFDYGDPATAEALAKLPRGLTYCLRWSAVRSAQNGQAPDFNALLAHFQRDSYLRVDGAPVFLIESAPIIRNLDQLVALWRQRAQAAGLAGLHLLTTLGTQPAHNWVPASLDGAVEVQPDFTASQNPVPGGAPAERMVRAAKLHPVQYRGTTIPLPDELLREHMARVAVDPDLPEPLLFVHSSNGASLDPIKRAAAETLPAAPARPLDADVVVVQACELLDNGDGVHRFHAPSRALSRLPGVAVVDVDVNHHLFHPLVEEADVLILAGAGGDLLPVITRRRAAGRITVLEANDHYYDLQPWNPLFEKWLDRGLQDMFLRLLREVDGIQTSTPELVHLWRKLTDKPIAVFENQLATVPDLPTRPQRPITIGWGGSPGHFADLYHIAPTIQRWLMAHPEVHLHIMTSEYAKDFFQLPAQRYTFKNFGSLEDYFEFLRGIDIGLAMQLPTGYNRGRSDVKFVEYATHGVVGIYPAMECYHTVVDGQTGLIYRSEKELVAHLDRLLADAVLRQRIREQAHAYVAQNRRLENHVHKRLEFYRSLQAGVQPPRALCLSPEVMSAAERDERYLRLGRGAPEDTFVAWLGKPTSPEGIEAMGRIVTRHPRYLQALVMLAGMLNEKRRTQEAVQVLAQALEIAPGHPRALAELGRSCFLNKDYAAARQYLEQALNIAPYFQMAWQYLLRLLKLTHDPNGAAWVERARRNNPGHFALALLAAQLLAPADVVRFLREWLEEFAPLFLPEELGRAGAAFADTVRTQCFGELATLPGLDLMGRAAKVFPYSAQVAHYYGLALRGAGREQEGYEEFERALHLRRVFQAYQSEFGKDQGTHHYWQFAEHIRDWTLRRPRLPEPPIQ
jgi:tetratricopeptide (TPR) repeat protein